ncbi:MAG: LLM class flavin-dependent oxidoreductase [Candidatus Binatia bacterium]
MRRVCVGYQDACMHPLWLSSASLRMARIFGAESLWVQDHFMWFLPRHVWQVEHTPAAKVIRSTDALFDPIAILALAASRIRGVDIGTAVTEPFRRHPMSLAQTFVTLDHLSRGHAILGIGNGEKENVEPYGIRWHAQVSRLEEALTIIRLLWESGGAPVSYEGRFWTLKDAIFHLPLYRGRPPRIWVAAHAPRMLGLAGRFGDGWLPNQKHCAADYRNRLQTIAEAREKAGRSMENFVAGQLLLVALGENRDAVLERMLESRVGAALSLLIPAASWTKHGRKHPLGDDHMGFYDIIPTRISAAHVDQAASSMTPELWRSFLYTGSPAQVRDEVAEIVDAGARHLVIANVGGAVAGSSPASVWRLGSLIRKLRRL